MLAGINCDLCATLSETARLTIYVAIVEQHLCAVGRLRRLWKLDDVLVPAAGAGAADCLAGRHILNSSIDFPPPRRWIEFVSRQINSPDVNGDDSVTRKAARSMGIRSKCMVDD